MKGTQAAAKRQSAWNGVEASVIDPAHVDGLLKRESAFVRVAGFLPAAWCQQVVRRLREASPPLYESYDIRLLPYLDGNAGEKMLQVGFSLGQAQLQSRTKDYFSRSREIYRTLRGLYAGGDDPLLKVQAMLAETAGWRIIQAEEQGDPYIPDMIWVMPTGMPLRLHVDSPHAMRPYQISRYDCQMSCNVYLSTPTAGGELVIYRERPASITGPRGADELRRLGAAVCRPEQGDLVLFNSVNYHEVKEPSGDVPRILGHSAIAFAPQDRSAIFWV